MEFNQQQKEDSIQIAAPPPQPEPINVDTGSYKPPLQEDAVQQRSKKAFWGLSPLLGRSYDEYHDDIASGREGALRTEAAAAADRKNDVRRSMLIQEIANRQGPQTSDQHQFVKDKLTLANLIGPAVKTDPSSVIEEYYAGQYLKPMYDLSDQFTARGGVPDVMKDTPVEARADIAKGTDILARMEYARTRLKDMESVYGQQSWTGWTIDQLKNMAPGYMEFKLRGWTDQTSEFRGMLGENLYQQARELLSLSMDEFKPKFNKILNKLKEDNPTLAVQFASYVVGRSTSDINIDNQLTLVEAAGLIGAPAIKVSKLNWFKRGLKDTIQQAGRDPITEGAIAAGRGDLSAAATHEAAAGIVTDITHADPRQRIKAELPKIFQTAKQDIGADPGSHAQEQINRLYEQYDANKDLFMDRVENTQKVNRIPFITSVEENTKKLLAFSKDLYPGLKNRILSSTHLAYDPVTVTHHVGLDLGTYEGEYFRTAAEATAAGKLEGLIPANDTLRSRYNKEFGERSSELRYKRDKLKEVGGRQKDVDLIEQELEKLYSWHAEKLTEPEIYMQNAGGFTVEQSGQGHFLRVYRPLNETQNVVRDMILDTENAKHFKSNWFGSLWPMPWLRTPEETLPKDIRMSRDVGTFAISKYLEASEQNNKIIQNIRGKFGRGKWKDFEKVLEYGQGLNDADGQRGVTFKGVGQLEDAYRSTVGRRPDDQEVAAYFAYKRNGEIDLQYRRLLLLKNKLRVGVENHQFSVIDEQGKAFNSPNFEAVTRNAAPGGAHNGLMVMGRTLGQEKIYSTSSPEYAKIRDQLAKDIKEGKVQLAEVLYPERMPFRDFGTVAGENRIRYVATNKFTTKALALDDQVPSRGGGHFIREYPQYLKQAIIQRDPLTGQAIYNGDRTLMPMAVRAQANIVAKHLNAVRELLKNKDIEGAKTYHSTNQQHLPFDWDEHYGWYKESRDPNGKAIPPHLDLDEPIQVVRNNKLINDMGKEFLENRYLNPITRKPDFIDGTKQGSLGRAMAVEFTGERDANDIFTINDKGTKYNPVFAHEPAKLLDPITAMNRAMARIAHSTFMDDVKIQSQENWLKQAENSLKPDSNDIWHAPAYHFANPEYRSGVDGKLKMELEANRWKIEQFTGVPSKMNNYLLSVQQQITDSIYGKFGPKALEVTPTWLLPKLRDPARFVRSIVANEKLGLYSLPQFFMQGMTYGNVFWIAGPKYAAPGMKATLFHQYLRINGTPENVAHFDNLATKRLIPGTARFKPGDFAKFREEGFKTGFFTMEGEHSQGMVNMSTNTIRSGTNAFLDIGLTPFREGARNTRIAAWYTASLEMNEKKPFGRWTDADRQDVLNRAATLNHDMDRSSASKLHSGLMSLPMQFVTYNLRLMELMTGKRLTKMEKARLFFGNWAMYGAGGALGLYSAGVPLGDFLQRKAQDLGYVVGDNAFKDILMNGLGQAALAVISGGGDYHKGNQYNVGEHWGPRGVGAELERDQTMMQIMGGAAYSEASSMLSKTSGLWRATTSAIKGDGEFKLKTEDFLDIIKGVAAVNNVLRLKYAIQTGNWMSRNGIKMGEVSVANALFMSITGLQTQQMTDVQTKRTTLAAEQADEKRTLSLFLGEMHKYYEAMTNHDPDTAHDYAKRAMVYLHINGYPEEKLGQAFAISADQDKDLVDRVDWSYYMKDVPSTRAEAARKAYETIQKLKAGKK